MSLKEKLKQRGKNKKQPVPISDPMPPALVTTRPTGSMAQASKNDIKVVQKIYESIPQEEIIEALQHSKHQGAVKLLEILHDPGFDNMSFALKCREAGIYPEHVWREVIALHKLDGDIRVARRIPQIMESIAEEAAPRVQQCPKCRGIGSLPPKKNSDERDECPVCGGQGSLIIPADTDARKLALEAIGVIGQKGPLIDARSVSISGGGGAGDLGVPDMTDWSRSTDAEFEERHTYNRQSIPEGEVVDDES